MMKLCRVHHIWTQTYITTTDAMRQTDAEASALLHRLWLAGAVIMHHWYCILYTA